MKEYIKPRSMTFWAGAASVICGVLIAVHQAQPLGWVADALVNMIGHDTSPALLITSGFAAIGIRRKQGA